MKLEQASADSASAPEVTPSYYNHLVEGFRFELNGHEVIEPSEDRGRVTRIEEKSPISLAGNELPPRVNVYEIFVEDPYIKADPEGYKLVTDHVEKTEAMMHQFGYSPSMRVFEAMQDPRKSAVPIRYEATKRDEYNDFTKAWIEDATADGIRIWRDLVPTADALEYLLHPRVGREIENRVGEVVINSPESAIQMRFVADSVAIRDRAVAMQRVALDYLEKVGPANGHIKWLSLATGTAEPAMAAAKAVKDSHGVETQLTLADIDANALSHSSDNAQKYGFQEGKDYTTVRTNIVGKRLSKDLTQATGMEELQFDVVENMGFQEYLPQDGDEIKAFKGGNLPQASDFTRSAYSLVRPGGVLISGNMVYPRTQFDYVFGIVDWPIINARSEESILRVYKEAGILDDANSQIDIFRVKNEASGIHVYDIVRVTKLA